MDDLDELLENYDKVFETRDPIKIQSWYSVNANQYDKAFATGSHEYNGPSLFVSNILNLNLPRSIKILEIGAGTGLLGSLLRANGYTNIDALDANKELLEIAKQKNCYKNFINSFISKDIRLSIEDNTYDMIAMVGCLAPGHIKWDSFPEIIRITKHGGLIMFLEGLPEVYSYDEEYGSGENEKIIESLCAQNKWKHLPDFPKYAKEYFEHEDGIIYAMKVM